MCVCVCVLTNTVNFSNRAREVIGPSKCGPITLYGRLESNKTPIGTDYNNVYMYIYINESIKIIVIFFIIEFIDDYFSTYKKKIIIINDDYASQ